MIKKIKDLMSTYREQLLYLIFGGLTTVVDWAVSFLLYHFWGDAIKETVYLIHIANLIAWVAAVAFAYVTNRIWVFRSTRRGFLPILGEIGSFAGSRVLTFLLQEGIFLVFFDILSVNEYLVKLVAAVLVIILNYIFSKLFVFRKNTKKDDASRFTWKNREFYLDGKPFRIYSGSVHYFRSLPEQWPALLQKIKDVGFNTVETYCAWNLHEKHPGEYDFSGRLDLERFLSTAQELGLYAIVRPGPFVCAEWEFGGFPGWLLANPDIRLRTMDPAYTEPLTAYMDQLLPHLVPHLITNGGNVLMVAAENEYGSFGNDHAYMEWCARLLEDRGIDVPIFTADGHRQMFLNGGHAGNRLCCLDFGFHKGITYEYDALDSYMPDAPRMCVEHWVGNFTQWGEPFRKYDGDIVAHEVERHLELDASFNMYMFHGGTNYAFYNGANAFYKDPINPRKVTYFADTTSYDYDAPLTEWGECTPKYFAIQKVMERHLGKNLPRPAPVPVQNIGDVKLTPAGGLFANLDNIGTHHQSNQLYSMEHFGQSLGYILYRKKIEGIIDPKYLVFGKMADRMHVYFNGVYRGTIHRNDEKQYIECADWLTDGGTLDLLVENLGRINFGVEVLLGDRKGILDYVYVHASCRQFLTDWEIWTLPMDSLDKLKSIENEKPNLPTFYRGSFRAPEKKDCFIHPDGFTKGFIVVNGFNLGRYWNIGPQYSLYLPYPILKDENEILVFDEEPVQNPMVRILDHHVLDKMQEDETPDVIV